MEWVNVYGVQPNGAEGRFRRMPAIVWRATLDLMLRAALPGDRRLLRLHARLRNQPEEITTAPSDLCLRVAGSLKRQLMNAPSLEWFSGKHDGLYWRNAQREFVISERPLPGFVKGCSLTRLELLDWIEFLLCCGGFVVHADDSVESARPRRRSQ